MRDAPHPLAVHLGMVAANMSGIQKYAANFPDAISEADAVQMVRGIKMYQEHDFTPKPMPNETIWSDASLSIVKPSQSKVTSSNPLLLVPSLINKASILDISQERSMLRWFNNQGIETYLLDWGDLCLDDNMNSIIEKLCGAVRAVSKITGKPVDVLGYCMGGTLLMQGYAYASDHIRRVILLASPWDFGVGALAQNVRIWSPAVLPVVKQRGCLPADWVQALFASLDPNGSAQKFIRFASMDQDGLEAKLFVSVEDWLNDGVDLPKDVAQHCIQDWFTDNSLATSSLEIDADILVLASKADRLVPFDCAAAIKASLNVDVIELNCGHIGLIVGRNAVNDVWKPILNWLNK